MSLVNETHARPEANPARPTEYLSFSLAGGEYAVDILHVREIRGIGPIAPLPNAPPQMRGVMNLRGAVVPVIDLRIAIGLPEGEYNKFSVIVVLYVRGRTIGFLVDSVCDVVPLEDGQIEKSSDFGARVDESLIGGIARVDDRFIILLNIEQVVEGEIGSPDTGDDG